MCRINFLITFRMVDFFHIFIPLGGVQNPLWISLFAGNVTIHPPYHIYSQLKILFDQNLSNSRYNKNLKKNKHKGKLLKIYFCSFFSYTLFFLFFLLFVVSCSRYFVVNDTTKIFNKSTSMLTIFFNFSWQITICYLQ